jgi:hypothetical protein
MEIFMGLLLYAVYTPLQGSYGAETWSLWILTISWGFSPFWFNPMAFEYDKILADVADWRNWMSRAEGDLSRSYQAWWLDEYGYYQQLTLTQRLVQCLFASRFLLIGVGLLYQRSTSALEISLCLAFVVSVLSVYALIRVDFCDQNQFVQRSLKVVCVTVALTLPIVLLTSNASALPSNMLGSALQIMLGLAYILGFLVDALLFFGLQWRLLLKLAKIYDWGLGLLLLAPVFLLSLLYVPTIVQTRLMFNNAFSRGVIIEDLLRGKKAAGGAPSVSAAAAPSSSSSSANQQQTNERLDQLARMLTEQSLIIARQREAIEQLQAAQGQGQGHGQGQGQPPPRPASSNSLASLAASGSSGSSGSLSSLVFQQQQMQRSKEKEQRDASLGRRLPTIASSPASPSHMAQIERFFTSAATAGSSSSSSGRGLAEVADHGGSGQQKGGLGCALQQPEYDELDEVEVDHRPIPATVALSDAVVITPKQK